jgi:hypothetical protein
VRPQAQPSKRHYPPWLQISIEHTQMSFTDPRTRLLLLKNYYRIESLAQ